LALQQNIHKGYFQCIKYKVLAANRQNIQKTKPSYYAIYPYICFRLALELAGPMEAPMEAASTGPVSAEFPIKEPLGFAYVCKFTLLQILPFVFISL